MSSFSDIFPIKISTCNFNKKRMDSMNTKGLFLNSVRENLRPEDKKEIDNQMEELEEKKKTLTNDQLTAYMYRNMR